MKKEEMIYKQLLAGIRKHPPVCNEPDEMTEAVMKRIEELPRLQTKKQRRMYIAGWISTVAASVLICFMIGDVFFYPEQHIRKTSAPAITESNQVQQQVGNLFPELTLHEKNKLFSSIIERRKEIQLKREQLRRLLK